MTSGNPQQLRVLPGEFVIEHPGHDAGAPAGEWLAVVRAPEGLTVVRRSEPGGDPGSERWSALYSGDTAHGVDVPGMLAALLVPLAAGGVPVFVASTFHADVVLVPTGSLSTAQAALRKAGHTLT